MLESLGEAALRNLLLAAAVLCLTRLLRIRHPQLLLPLWTAVLLASILMPVLPQLAPIHLPLDPARATPWIEGAADLLPLSSVMPTITAAARRMQPPPIPWLACINLIVSSCILLRVLTGAALSLRLLCRAVPIHPEWTTGHRVRISPDITAPMTIAHTILLPPDATSWPADIRHAVLAHEHAHVARRDFALLILSQLNVALFWFSPLSWWLHRRLVTLTELAADDHAIPCCHDPLRYAEILLLMARRSGPLPQGPAIARPATLSVRIDRILAGQALVHTVSTPRQAMLAAGVAGLSIAIASLIAAPAHHPVLEAVRPGTPPGNEHAGTPRHDLVQQTAAPPVPGRPAATAFRTPPPARPPTRRTLQTIVRTAPPSPPRPLTSPMQVIAARASGVDAPAAPSTPIDEKTPPPLIHQVAYSTPLPPQQEFQAVIGSICRGTVVIGQGAQSSSDKRPFVTAGQSIPASAHFYLKPNGTPWVRFGAFDEPSLDLPVHVTRNGITWTGDYGIAYTVQPAGPDRLAGLAALIRNDSARISLTCVKSGLHFL